MIEYDITDQSRKDIEFRSFFKSLFLLALVSIPVTIRLGTFWGGLLIISLVFFDIIYLIYTNLKKESYKVRIDDKGITKIWANKQKGVLFSDIKGRYPSETSKNNLILNVSAHKFFEVPSFTFMVPDQYVHQVSALLPPENISGIKPQKSYKLYYVLSIVVAVTIGILYLGQFIINNNIHIGKQNWVEHVSTRGNFKISFPREPQEKVYEKNGQDILNSSVTTSGEGNLNELFVVVFTEFPGTTSSTKLDEAASKLYLDSNKNNILKKSNYSLITSEYSSFKGNISIDLLMSMDQKDNQNISHKYYVKDKIFYNGNLLYQLLNIEPNNSFPDYQKFTSSFNFL